MSPNIKETIEIVDEKKFNDEQSSTDVASFDSTNGSEILQEGYVQDLQWTAEEERAIVNKIDIKLMSFVLLMTFVLNMDRTNICKLFFFG